jgi:sugar-phosphatase
MIKVAIFDMDGVLIDSEPFWVEAEIKVLGELGVPLTPEMTAQIPPGLREDEVVRYWHEQYPWRGVSIGKAADRIERQVAELIRKNGKAMPGVDKAIKLCLSKNLPLAIASSSSLLLIRAVMGKLGIAKDISVVCSAYSEPLGKPHPGVYLRALRELNRVSNNHTREKECLVFEDSLNGIAAAKAAKMQCIAIPRAEFLSDKRFGIADAVIHSLDEVSQELFTKLDRLTS